MMRQKIEQKKTNNSLMSKTLNLQEKINKTTQDLIELYEENNRLLLSIEKMDQDICQYKQNIQITNY